MMLEVETELEELSFEFDSSEGDGVHLCLSSSNCNCDATLLKSTPVSGSSKAEARRWSEEEDNLLIQIVKKHEARNWKKIAAYLSGRTEAQCLHRWQKVLDPDLVKGYWTKEEDDRLTELVRKYGLKRWAEIAKFLPGRIGKQCRERWHNNLDPAIKKDAWREEEELALAHYHQIYGSKWAVIARYLPGRSDNAIKNHWNRSMKKKGDASSHLGFDLNVATSSFRTSPIVPAHVSVKVDSHSFNEMDSKHRVDNFPTHLVLQKPSKSPKRQKVSSSDAKRDQVGNGSNNKISSTCHNADDMSNDIGCGDNNDSRDTRTIFEQSPERVLRSLAMTYENIPSIIRKRTPTKAECAQTPEDERVISLRNLKLSREFIPSIITTPNTKAIAKSLEGYME
ncbi:uncharacterized protein [Arachis hypogaea]|uniref:Uncharacterized protein n=1 Tax=Arachis hypogaea TaxID=3818 RepID=A0A445D647_ARAHY|nr:myb-related protein B isoform X1 [Arachis hypogaea]XP_025700046.1 myb-related protein B isoform X1 [Arachis hypogaea]RYR58717.1 hypothetical protein Ahy_A05g024604 [Arachis hypogaea]